jgi:hypothetical protein
MSWLSELFGGGDEGPGERQWRIYNEQQAAKAQQDAQIAAQERQQQQQIAYLDKLRADQLAEQERQRALDPTATRQAALSTVGQTFTPGFEEMYVPGTLTDPYETAVYGEQRSKADEFLNNLFKRNVITETGRQAGMKNLEEQAPRVRTQLQDIADTLLGAERGKLGNIAGSAREAASSLGVNQPFDISPYSTRLTGDVGEFTSQLSDRFRAGIPGDLFDTSGLGAIAGGAGGGAGSGTGVPSDLFAGLDTSKKEDETDPFTGQKPVQKRTSTVF